MLETLELVKKEILEYEQSAKELYESISILEESLGKKKVCLEKVQEMLKAYKDQAGKLRGLYQ